MVTQMQVEALLAGNRMTTICEAETIKEKNKDNTESGTVSVSVLSKVLSLD